MFSPNTFSNKNRAALSLLALTGFALGAQEAEDSEAASERGVRIHTEQATEGFTLFSPLGSLSTFLIDMDGNAVHEWRSELTPTGAVYLLENGRLLRCGTIQDNPRFEGGGMGGRVEEFDWNGERTWVYELANDYQTQHHDIEPLPNGNILLITWEFRYPDDAVEWGRDPEVVTEAGMWPDAVLEIQPTRPEGGEIVWEWHAWDHVVQDRNPDLPGYASIAESPGRIDINADHRDAPISDEERERLAAIEEEMRALGYTGGDEDEQEEEDADDGLGDAGRPDWLHTNGVDYHPEYDLIALSVPELNEVWVIDHSTSTDKAMWDSGGRWKHGGDLLYRWGNPRMWGMGTEDDQRLWYQHNPEWILDAPEGELRLLIFNNGGGRPDGDHSSVIELVLPFDPERGFLREEGAPFGPAEPAWSYSAPGEFFSSFISGAHRLASGNTLICSGAPGRVFEVTPDGEIAWEFLNTFGQDSAAPSSGAPPFALFRATRILPDHPGLQGRFEK